MATPAATTSHPYGVTTTSWLPFTTPGPSLPPQCSTAFYLNPHDPASIAAFDPWYGQNVNTSLKCGAAQQTTWWDQPDLASSTYWNLGPLACPSGYITATTASVNAQSTILACCPSGYQFQNDILPAGSATECLSEVPSGQVITPLSYTDGSWVPTTISVSGPGVLIHGVQINGWNFATSSVPGTSSSSSISAPITTSTPQSTTNPLPNSNSSSSQSTAAISTQGGLSTGAKVGLGVGVSLGVIGLCCLVAFVFFRRGRSASKTGDWKYPSDYYSHDREVRKAEMETPLRYAEVSGNNPQRYAEVPGEPRPQNAPAELG